MGFRDVDRFEAMLGKHAEDMTDSELVSYIKSFMSAVHDLKLPLSGQRERSIMACLQRTYGRRDAGMLVKWAMWKHDGVVNGKPLTYSSFSKGMKWLTDQMYVEMQQHLQKEQRKSTVSQPFSSMSEL